MVDGFQDRSPGCHADTGTDEDGDFVLEDVFGGCTVGTVDAESRHLLAMLKCYFIHAHWVEFVVELALRLSGA